MTLTFNIDTTTIVLGIGLICGLVYLFYQLIKDQERMKNSLTAHLEVLCSHDDFNKQQIEFNKLVSRFTDSISESYGTTHILPDLILFKYILHTLDKTKIAAIPGETEVDKDLFIVELFKELLPEHADLIKTKVSIISSEKVEKSDSQSPS